MICQERTKQNDKKKMVLVTREIYRAIAHLQLDAFEWLNEAAYRSYSTGTRAYDAFVEPPFLYDLMGRMERSRAFLIDTLAVISLHCAHSISFFDVTSVGDLDYVRRSSLQHRLKESFTALLDGTNELLVDVQRVLAGARASS